MDAAPFKLYFSITAIKLHFYIYFAHHMQCIVYVGLAACLYARMCSSSSSKISFYHKSAVLYCFMLSLRVEITADSNFQINGHKIMGFKCVKGTSFQYCNATVSN